VKHEIISFDFCLDSLKKFERKYDLANFTNIKISNGAIKGIILNST
tara:strand:- start:348 stop:485 length:138 start_codon:yes stop_codon:yes gene_type:complete